RGCSKPRPGAPPVGQRVGSRIGMKPGEAARPDEGELPGLIRAFFLEVEEALAARDLERITTVIENLHPADVAELLEALGPEDRRVLLELVGNNLEPETLSYLEESLREEVAEALGPQVVANILELLESDD